MFILPAMLGSCGVVAERPSIFVPATTSGAIAIANLEHVLAHPRDDHDEIVELLLARAMFLADYEAFDRVAAVTEGRSSTAAELLRRARARSAVHRFAEALADLEAAERLGAAEEVVAELRATILVVTGSAREAIALLEPRVAARPTLATLTALAAAYAADGHLEEADRLYANALADLSTTSPFPYAWIYFARGKMWAEKGHDPARAEPLLGRALAYLPQFAAASIHLAELEIARGDRHAAAGRLARVAAASGEPEAHALLGELLLTAGDAERGCRQLRVARERFGTLLARQPAAFSEHYATHRDRLAHCTGAG